jgi:NitT/TauT family transport system substrate-binding protein
MPMMQTRRRFLATTLSLAGAAGLVRAPPVPAAEGPPEVTSVRIVKIPGDCQAPIHIAEELLHTEGFTDVRYVDRPGNALPETIAREEADFGLAFATDSVSMIDRGIAITVLSGVHVGCIELFANEGVGSIGDLKGKRVGVPGFGTSPHVLITVIAAQVGLDPSKDIRWVVDPSATQKQLFIEGKIDAFLGLPPDPQELRARQVGRVVLNSAVDRPWSQYFCCVLIGNREFVRRNPVATKRTMRAILKAADFCAGDPARAAQRLVDRGLTPRYDYALQTLSELPYDKWREYDHEDTIRFCALRLHEVGFIKSSPQKIIADGTDWRFLNELKRELKA